MMARVRARHTRKTHGYGIRDFVVCRWEVAGGLMRGLAVKEALGATREGSGASTTVVYMCPCDEKHRAALPRRIVVPTLLAFQTIEDEGEKGGRRIFTTVKELKV